MSTNIPQAEGNNRSLLAQGIASAAVYSAIYVVIARFYLTSVNYRTLPKNGPSLNAALEKAVFVISDMKYILNDGKFNSALDDEETTQPEKLLAINE